MNLIIIITKRCAYVCVCVSGCRGIPLIWLQASIELQMFVLFTACPNTLLDRQQSTNNEHQRLRSIWTLFAICVYGNPLQKLDTTQFIYVLIICDTHTNKYVLWSTCNIHRVIFSCSTRIGRRGNNILLLFFDFSPCHVRASPVSTNSHFLLTGLTTIEALNTNLPWEYYNKNSY